MREWQDTDREFRPMVFSTEGRMHPVTERIIGYCSARIAARDGTSANRIKKRWHAELGVTLAMRRAKMARQYLMGAVTSNPDESNGAMELPLVDAYENAWASFCAEA
eukprot:140867-Karenia_brevis.AAC.1